MKKVVGDFSTVLCMSMEEAKDICRLGKGSECCAFLVMSPQGFECIRMDYPSNSLIFDRLEKGTMNAKGRGLWKGCPWHMEGVKSEDWATK